MAVGTVSGIDPDDNYQLITTTTITSGTGSYNYNSIAGYKTILIVGKDIVKNSSEYVNIQLNGNTAAGSYCQNQQLGTGNFFYVTGSTAGPSAFAFVIYNVNKTIPHKVDVTYSSAPGGPNQYYTDPSVITSIQVTSATATFTSGTIYVYGIPA